MSSSIPSWQISTAHAQPFRGATDLAFCLKVPLDSLLVWASSEGSCETARMRRLAWNFAARIGDKYQIRLTRSIYSSKIKNLFWSTTRRDTMCNLANISNSWLMEKSNTFCPSFHKRLHHFSYLNPKIICQFRAAQSGYTLFVKSLVSYYLVELPNIDFQSDMVVKSFLILSIIQLPVLKTYNGKQGLSLPMLRSCTEKKLNFPIL